MITLWKRLIEHLKEKNRQYEIEQLKVGDEWVRFPAPDMRVDIIIADMSRIDEDLVGVRRSAIPVLGYKGPIPKYADEIQYISLWEITEYPAQCKKPRRIVS
jgi:hypothetical protein